MPPPMEKRDRKIGEVPGELPLRNSDGRRLKDLTEFPTVGRGKPVKPTKTLLVFSLVFVTTVVVGLVLTS